MQQPTRNGSLGDHALPVTGRLDMNYTGLSSTAGDGMRDARMNATHFYGADDEALSCAQGRYMNVTDDIPIRFAQPMYGYIIPFLLVITIIANTLVVIVLSRKHLRSPTNAVLLVMAVYDMLTLLIPSPWFFYMYTMGYHYKPLGPAITCRVYMAMTETLPAMFHTASIWLTLALAVQRYIYVCHAPLARTWCTMKRVVRYIVYISLAAFLHQLPRFFDTVYISCNMPWPTGEEQVCVQETAYWVMNWITEDLYFVTYFGFRVLFVHLVPCVALVVLNVLLFMAMREAQLRRDKLFQENRKAECKRLRDSNCTTLMLIVVVTVFLLVEIPVAVVTMLHIVSLMITEILDYSVANILILFTNFFIIVSYPINFAIYCGMSRQFRETFKDLFLKKFLAQKYRRPDTGSSRYSVVNGPKTYTNTNETVL